MSWVWCKWSVFSLLFVPVEEWLAAHTAPLLPFNLFTFNPPPPQYHTGWSLVHCSARECVSKYEWSFLPILIRCLFACRVVTRQEKDISWCITTHGDADLRGGGLFVPLSLSFLPNKCRKGQPLLSCRVQQDAEFNNEGLIYIYRYINPHRC